MSAMIRARRRARFLMLRMVFSGASVNRVATPHHHIIGRWSKSGTSVPSLIASLAFPGADQIQVSLARPGNIVNAVNNGGGQPVCFRDQHFHL